MQFDINSFWTQYKKYFSNPTDDELYHLPFILNLASQDKNIDGVYQLAYMLATAMWETGQFKYLDEQGSEKYFSKYQNKICNTQTGDAQRYRGRGYVQLTGRANYKTATEKLNLPGVNFEDSPFLAADPKYAYQIMVRGCLEGWFTGRKLSDYVTVDGSKRDYKNARNVINPGELKEENAPGVENTTLWAGYFELILQNSIAEEALPEIPPEYIEDASENTKSSVPKLVVQPTAQIPATQAAFSSPIAAYVDKAKEVLPASITTIKRFGAMLIGCLSSISMSVAAFIKSEPVISEIVIGTALVCLIWLISFYIYTEHVLDSKRMQATSSPTKNSVK